MNIINMPALPLLVSYSLMTLMHFTKTPFLDVCFDSCDP